MNENAERIEKRDETRSEKIARIVSKLSDEEQEKIYYMIKGIELAGANKRNFTSHAAEV